VPSFGLGWAFHVGGPTADHGEGIATDGAGNLYVSGWFNGTANFDPNGTNPGNPNNTLTAAAGSYTGFAAKYAAADGRFQWVTQLGPVYSKSGIAVHGSDVYVLASNGSESTTSVSRLDAATGAVVGTALLPGDTWAVAVGPASGNVYVSGEVSGEQAFVSKFDAALTPQWTVTTSSTSGGTTFGYGMAVSDDPASGTESAYLAGGYTGTVAFGANTPALTKTSLSSSGNAFVWKLNSDGTPAAVTSLGTSTGAVASSIAVDGSGNVYVTGATDDKSGIPSSIFVDKLTPALSLTWARSFTGHNTYGSGQAVAVDGAGHVYTTGSFGGSVDFDPGPGTYVLVSSLSKGGNGGLGGFVSELDAAGSFVAAGAMTSNTVAPLGRGEGIVVDPAGPAPNVYTTGILAGTMDFDPTSGTYTLTSSGNTDVFVAKWTQVNPLLAAGGAATEAKAARLTDAQLQPIVAAAIDRWAAAGLDAADLAVLRHATVTVADLGGSYLGLADAQTHAVRIDDDAGGHGWFVDPTPRDDAEFAKPGDKRVAGRMDLLSAVAHELGHLVGLDDDHDKGHAADVMGDTLTAGTRRTPTAADVWPVAADVSPVPIRGRAGRR
jgi:hypothetical protein